MGIFTQFIARLAELTIYYLPKIVFNDSIQY